MRGQKQLFSTGKDDWGTPWWLFNLLHERFKFTIDLAASKKNAKLPRYFTEEDDALKQSWSGERGFLNPPYTLAPEFIAKSHSEFKYASAFSAILVPARVSNSEWHEFVLPDAQELIIIRGRVIFEGAETGAPFPSCVIVFDPLRKGERLVISTIDSRPHQARIKADDRASTTRQIASVLHNVLDRGSVGTPPEVQAAEGPRVNV